MCRLRWRALLAGLAGMALASTTLAQPVVPRGGALDGERFRILISTDLGGSDQDDMQSLVHLLLYADLFDIDGLVASPPGAGRAGHILDLLEAYAQDWPVLRRASPTYPSPDALRRVTRQGAVTPAPPAGWSTSTPGSRWIVEQARRPDPRPLHVLVWGSITDVAQAIHDAPGIKDRLRVYFIASWNRQQDPAAFRYLDEEHPDLWLIQAETTFRGWYMGGPQDGDLGNVRFVREHVCGRGALGTLFCGLAPALGEASTGRIKMGDTPSLAYLLRGQAGDPTAEHWGGRFVPHPAGRPRWWVDDPSPAWQVADRAGARTVSQYREQFLRDWQQRMRRLPMTTTGRHQAAND